MRFYVLLLMAVFFSCPILSKEYGDSISYVTDAYKWYPKYVTFLPIAKLDSVLYYADTDIVPVIYKVNKTNIRPNSQLDSIVQVINRIQHDERVNLAYVWIGASASPEGPAQWNMTLGEKRAQALADYLLTNTELPSHKLKIENLGEDWYSLEKKLKNSNLSNQDTILSILKNEPDFEKRKHQIQSLDHNRTWHNLIQNIFPPFRNARMVIVCSSEPPMKLNAKPINTLASLTPLYTIPSINPLPFFKPEPKNGDTRFFALKTNGVFLGGLIANVSFETELWRHWSLDFPIYYSPYNLFKESRKLRLLAIQPEVRYWLGKAGEGHFLGLHTHVAGFNVAVNKHGRYQDPNHALWGLGLGYGYSFNFGKEKRWGVELNIGLGFADYKYDAYRNWENGPKYSSGSDCYWGITRAGVSIFYKWHKNRKHK